MDALFQHAGLIPTIPSQVPEGATPVPAEPQPQGGTIEPTEVSPIIQQE